METAFSLIGAALLVCCASFSAHATTAPADDAPAIAGKTPTQACEAAVTTAIQRSRGAGATQVQFVVPKRAARPVSAASEAVQDSVQGEGHYQGSGGRMPFTYSCALDTQTHEATGVIFKETDEPARHAEKPWQADLAHLSPEVCDSGAARAVKDKYPRAVNVVLSSQSRQLSAAPNNHTYLHGQGHMERAEGMAPSAFTYRCELDTASGKLLGVQLDLVE